MEGKYLPIGSVIKLKNGEKCLMIVGYGLTNKNGEKKECYDYCVTPWPEGNINLEKIILCNHEDIENVVFKGYSSDESVKWLQYVEKALDEMKKYNGNIDEMVKTINNSSNESNNADLTEPEIVNNNSIVDSSKSVIGTDIETEEQNGEATISIVEES